MLVKEELLDRVREGMKVFGADDQPIGTVEAVEEHALRVNGRAIPETAIDSVIKRHVYLEEPAATYPAAEPGADAASDTVA